MGREGGRVQISVRITDKLTLYNATLMLQFDWLNTGEAERELESIFASPWIVLDHIIVISKYDAVTQHDTGFCSL